MHEVTEDVPRSSPFISGGLVETVVATDDRFYIEFQVLQVLRSERLPDPLGTIVVAVLKIVSFDLAVKCLIQQQLGFLTHLPLIHMVVSVHL